jgi:hypothetical protein
MNFRLILPALFFFNVSCATSQVVFELVPEAPEGHFEMGREYIPLSSGNIDAELGYDGPFGEQLVFDFVVINGTEDTLVIDPSDFYYVVMDDPLADSSLFPPRMAVHPERVLHHYDEQLEKRQDRKSMNTVLGFIEAGIGLIATASGFVATENPGYIVDAVFNTVGTAGQYISADRSMGEEIKLISEEKVTVQQEIFRRTLLPPGKVTSGFVYFPVSEIQGYLMFCFPLQEQLFQFVYKQR